MILVIGFNSCSLLHPYEPNISLEAKSNSVDATFEIKIAVINDSDHLNLQIIECPIRIKGLNKEQLSRDKYISSLELTTIKPGETYEWYARGTTYPIIPYYFDVKIGINGIGSEFVYKTFTDVPMVIE
jgi:hypothetical protein